MRGAFHAELSELLGDLASRGQLASQLMISATASLLQADLALGELVVTRGDEMDARHHDVAQRCLTRLVPQAPGGSVDGGRCLARSA